MMRFRTLLIDPKGTFDRPKQALHMSTEQAADWANTQLALSSDLAHVTLYATVEVEVYTYRKPKPLVPAPAVPVPEVPKP